MSSKVLVVFTCLLFFGQIESEGPTLLSSAAFFGDPTIGQSPPPTQRRPPPPIPRREESQQAALWPESMLTIETEVLSEGNDFDVDSLASVENQDVDQPSDFFSSEPIHVSISDVRPNKAPPIPAPLAAKYGDQPVKKTKRRTQPNTPRNVPLPPIPTDVIVNPKLQPRKGQPPPPIPSYDSPELRTMTQVESQPGEPLRDITTGESVYADIVGQAEIQKPTPESSNVIYASLQGLGQETEQGTEVPGYEDQQPIYSEVTGTKRERSASLPLSTADSIYASIGHGYPASSDTSLSTQETQAPPLKPRNRGAPPPIPDYDFPEQTTKTQGFFSGIFGRSKETEKKARK